MNQVDELHKLTQKLKAQNEVMADLLPVLVAITFMGVVFLGTLAYHWIKELGWI